MAKPKKPPKGLFLVFANGEFQRQEDNYEEAETKAIELLEDSEVDVCILEVSRAWRVEFPEEPDPEIYLMNLENVYIA